MMKRLLILLWALLILCSLSALAEENVYDLIENAMYRIVLRTDAGDETLGSGVLYSSKQLLLTSSACTAEGELYAIGPDGEHAVSQAKNMADSGLALLEMATPAAGTPLHLASEGAAGMAALFGASADGEFIVAPLNHVRSSIFRGQSALLLSSSEGLLPGSFLTDEKGSLIGICIAQQVEGEGAYIALDANGLYRALTRQQYADVFLPASASWHEGILTITWTDEERGSGVYLISLSGDDNQYYTFFQAGHDERSIDLTIPPQHRYDFQVQWAKDPESAMEPVWSAMEEIYIPGAVFNQFGFTHTCDLVTRTDSHSRLTEVPDATYEVMASNALLRYLRVTAAYDVSEKHALPMTIELITPDGQFYFESAVHTFSPDKEKNDAFLLPLDALLLDCTDLSGGVLPYGQYTVRFAINGAKAGEYTFTLSKETKQSVEENIDLPPNGLITDLKAEYKNGMVTISWQADSVPKGATVTAYHMYGGNNYYVYHQVEQGASQTELFTVPGLETYIWVTWVLDPSAEAPQPTQQGDFIVLPAAPETAFTLNGFQNQRLSLTITDDPQAAEATLFYPEVKLTKDLLMDPANILLFQTEDTYQVTENSDGHPMMLVLCTPEGLCFTYPLEYLFDVTLQSSDLWLLDMTSLCRDYESLICGAWPSGDYRVMYCIDGQIAGEYHFTLE